MENHVQRYTTIETVLEVQDRRVCGDQWAGPGAPGTLIQSTARVTRNPVQAGYHSLPTERWTSEARFAADAVAGAILSYIRVAHYDNEKWSATPLVEQEHPSLYEKAFCQVAHAHGLLCATGPARAPNRLTCC